MWKFYAVILVTAACFFHFTLSNDDLKCSQCQLGVSTVKRVVNKEWIDNVMLSEVDELIRTSCTVGNMDMCFDVTRAVLQQIVHIVENYGKFEMCSELKMCQAVQREAIIEPKLPNLSEFDKCFLCRIIANYIIMGLKEEAIQQIIEKALLKACQELPRFLQEKCNNFVTEKTPDLIAVIGSHLNTEEICRTVKLCPTNI